MRKSHFNFGWKFEFRSKLSYYSCKVLIQVPRTFWPQAVIWPGVNHYRLPFFNFGDICSFFSLFIALLIIFDTRFHEMKPVFFSWISNLRLTFEVWRSWPAWFHFSISDRPKQSSFLGLALNVNHTELKWFLKRYSYFHAHFF